MALVVLIMMVRMVMIMMVRMVMMVLVFALLLMTRRSKCLVLIGASAGRE